jgi:hypothetical protein
VATAYQTKKKKLNKKTKNLLAKTLEDFRQKGKWAKGTYAVIVNGGRHSVDRDELLDLPTMGYTEFAYDNSIVHPFNELEIAQSCLVGNLIVNNNFKADESYSNAIRALAEAIEPGMVNGSYGDDYLEDVIITYNDSSSDKRRVVRLLENVLAD